MQRSLLDLNKKLDFLMMDIEEETRLKAETKAHEQLIFEFFKRKYEASNRVKALRKEAAETARRINIYIEMDALKRRIDEHTRNTGDDTDRMYDLIRRMGPISIRKRELEADKSKDNTAEIDKLSAEYDALDAERIPLSKRIHAPAIKEAQRAYDQHQAEISNTPIPPRGELEKQQNRIQREIAELTRKLDAIENEHPRIEQLFDERQRAHNAIVSRHAELPFSRSNNDDEIVIQREAIYRAVTAELAAAIQAVDEDDRF